MIHVSLRNIFTTGQHFFLFGSTLFSSLAISVSLWLIGLPFLSRFYAMPPIICPIKAFNLFIAIVERTWYAKDRTEHQKWLQPKGLHTYTVCITHTFIESVWWPNNDTLSLECISMALIWPAAIWCLPKFKWTHPMCVHIYSFLLAINKSVNKMNVRRCACLFSRTARIRMAISVSFTKFNCILRHVLFSSIVSLFFVWRGIQLTLGGSFCMCVNILNIVMNSLARTKAYSIFSCPIRVPDTLNFKRIHCPNLQFNFRMNELKIFPFNLYPQQQQQQQPYHQ